MKATQLMRSTVLIAVLALAAPAAAGGFSFNVHNNHGGFSMGSSGWSVYGASWHNPSWSVNYNYALAGYGDWLEVAGLGRVWRPYVTNEWSPYTHGRWTRTTYGWTWISYEPWGYFPHHYGEWALTAHGWAWKPGYVYHAANVVWVHSGSYIGWYAQAPHGWSHHYRGQHHSYNNGYRHGNQHGYNNGYWDGYNEARYATYVRWEHLDTADISRHRTSCKTVAHRSHHEPRAMNTAPSRSEISRRGGREAPRAEIESRHVNLNGRDVVMARPKNASRSVERHAPESVKRALSPSISRSHETETPRSASRTGKAVQSKTSTRRTNQQQEVKRVSSRRVEADRSTTSQHQKAETTRMRDSSRRPERRTTAPSTRSSQRPSQQKPATRPRSQAKEQNQRRARTETRNESSSKRPEKSARAPQTSRQQPKQRVTARSETSSRRSTESTRKREESRSSRQTKNTSRSRTTSRQQKKANK